jgi:hypothetical protein
MKNTQAETALRSWLTENGLSSQELENTDLHLLQAQRIAHNTLKYHAALLEQNQAAVLNNFLRTMVSGQRKKLKPAQVQKVMNIGAAVNRRLFKQHRQIKRAALGSNR